MPNDGDKKGNVPSGTLAIGPEQFFFSVQMNVTAGTGSFPWDY